MCVDLVQGAARSGLWAEENPKEAAKIASQYWNQPVELVEYALTTPEKRILYNQFVPKQGEMQYMADLIVRFDLLADNDVSGLIEDKFAKTVDLDDVNGIDSILRLP